MDVGAPRYVRCPTVVNPDGARGQGTGRSGRRAGGSGASARTGRPLTGSARFIRLAAIGSRVPHGRPCRPTGLGSARSSQEDREDRDSFFVAPDLRSRESTRGVRCTRTPSPPASAHWRPRRACEAWPRRVRVRKPASPHGEVGVWARRIRAAIRGSVISETQWEVVRRRAFQPGGPEGARLKGALPPRRTGEGRAPFSFLTTRVRVRAAQSAWGPAGADGRRLANATPGAVRPSPPLRGAPAAAQAMIIERCMLLIEMRL